MTEQEYIETLPEDQQQYISHMREAMARSGVSTPESMTIAILLDGQVVPTDMTLAIIWQMNTPNYQRVALDEVGETEVSTVFMTTGFPGFNGPPRHFETMTFGPDGSKTPGRYLTLEEAKAGHASVVEKLKRRHA